VWQCADRHQLQGLASPEEDEVLALQRAVLLAQEEGFDKVVFAIDYPSLVQRLNSWAMDRSSVGILVSGIKAAISLFTSVSFSHVKRNPNEATHVLAKTLW
jgi:hypothetical protein